jgi:beta-glucosidase
MKKNLINFLSLILFLYSCTGEINKNKYPYQDAGLPVEKRVTDLIGRMTIDEKIHQLDMYWGREVANMN